MAISLKISRIRKSFGDNIVLRDINLQAEGSEIVGLIGKSGCGKSTLLKILVGYLKPDSGNILLNGKKVSGNVMNLRRVVGYTTQENSFYEKLTVIENMRYYAKLYGIPLKREEKRVTELLERANLLKHKDILSENISGGMKRRLDFSISLVHNPSILLLDEPTAGLDPLLVDRFWNIVKKVIFEKNKIAIVSSHVLSEIEKYCTKVAIIEKGEVIKVLGKEELQGLEYKFREIVGDKRK